MPLINSILNIVGLLLWLNWLSIRFDPLAKTSAKTLVGTLRKADPTAPKRWLQLAALAGLIVIRAVIYCLVGPSLNWTPRLSLPPLEPAFRSDHFSSVLLFSTLSFLVALGAFYLSLLLLSIVNSAVPDTDPLQKLVRLYFKWLERWPALLKLLLPLIAGALFWMALHPLLSNLSVLSQTKSNSQLLEQSAIIGLGTYLLWKYVIVGILALHLLSSYIYFGEHAFWNFISVTARNLLRPFRWLPLQIGRIDLLPLAVIGLILLVVNFSSIADHFSHPRGAFQALALSSFALLIPCRKRNPDDDRSARVR